MRKRGQQKQIRMVHESALYLQVLVLEARERHLGHLTSIICAPTLWLLLVTADQVVRPQRAFNAGAPEATSVSGVAGRRGGRAVPTSGVSTEPSRSAFFGSAPLAHRLEKKQEID